MKTQALIKYREFDRKSNPTPFIFGKRQNYEGLKSDIKENGVKTPLMLWVYKGKALIVEGNHRLAIAIDLGIEDLPVKVTQITGKNMAEKEYINRINLKGSIL